MKSTRLAVVGLAGLIIGFLLSGLLRRPAEAVQPAGIERNNERSVVIQLAMDQNGGITGILDPVSDDPDSHGKEVGLRKSKRDIAHWVVSPPWADVRMEIDLKTGMPPLFSTPPASYGKHVVSGPVLKDAPQRKYDYWVKVHDNKTGKDWTLDPPIRVDP
jgi:hypothetical protein